MYRRKQFIRLNRQTQQAIVDILVLAEEINHYRNSHEALEYIQHTIWFKKHTDRPYHLTTDNNGVDWDQVNEHIIRGGCVNDDDMEGYSLDGNKLSGEITTFRGLMEIEPPEEDMF